MKTNMPGLLVLAAGFTFAAAVSRAVEPATEPLTLQDVIRIALENNPDLRLQEIDRQIAEKEARGESYYWEPEAVVSGKRYNNSRQNTVEQEISQFSPTFEERNTSLSAALEGTVASGGKWRLGYSLDELSNNLTNQNFRTRAAFDEEYASIASISFSQPLLRNFGPAVTRSQLRNAELNHEVAKQELRRRRMLTIGRAELGYWSAWQSVRAVDLRAKSLEIVKSLLEDNKNRLKEGRVSQMDVDQTRAGVALRERRWLEARTEANEAAKALASLLGWTARDAQPVIKAEILEIGDPVVTDFDQAMTRAVSSHPDMLIRQKEIEIENLRLVVARNQSWPQLDLVGSYGYNGLGEDVPESWDRLSEGEYQNWSVELVFRMGLGGDRKARSQLEQTKLRHERALLGYQATESDLANAMRSVMNKARLVRDTQLALARETDVNRAALDAEKVLLAEGKSNSRRVLELEEDLVDVQVLYETACANYRRVLVELDMTDGGMLARRGLEEAAKGPGFVEVTAAPQAPAPPPRGCPPPPPGAPPPWPPP
ncbi:MAG: TolC family protein, partial [Kiritimatiellia bacterium]